MTSNFQFSKHDLGYYILVIGIGVVIGLAIGMRGFHNEEDDHIPVKNTTKTESFKSSYGTYRHAAVASDSKTCSDVGRDVMLIHGGNAIDAAIATSMCAGALHSHSTGVGGGMVAIVYHKKHGWQAIDARETAPFGASRDMMDQRRAKGGLSICVPGIVKGYLEMHARFGSLPWKTLLDPTIRLLRDGFPLSAQTYTALVRVISPNIQHMKGYEMFLDDRNQIKSPGSLIQMPKLAKTMEIIAEDPMSFYNGSLAQDIIKDIQEAGSIITEHDLVQYKALVKRPTQLDMPGGKTLYSVPAPASGPTLSYILSTVAGYNMTPESVATNEASILTYHRLVEAIKFAYARKTALGDEDFVDVQSLVANLTSRSYGEHTRSLISDTKTHGVTYYKPIYYGSKQHGTSHSSILDREGNAVAITSSINLYFGSRIIGNRTGIIFNDQMNDFSQPNFQKYYGLQPSAANFIQAGKRPLSAMCPAILWDNVHNKVLLVAGAAGGNKIPPALASVIMNLYWFNMSVPEAIDSPRLLHELLPMSIQAEATLPRAIRVGLEEKGHSFLDPFGITVVQLIQVLEDAIVAGADFRKGGEPSGF